MRPIVLTLFMALIASPDTLPILLRSISKAIPKPASAKRNCTSGN